MATDPNAAIYEAIRKADAAGDSEAVAKLSGYLKQQLSPGSHIDPQGVQRGASGALRVDITPADQEPPQWAKTALGAASTMVGPQISRALADVASIGGEDGRAARLEAAGDQARGEFKRNHPYISTGLSMLGGLPVAASRGGAAFLGGINGALQSEGHDPLSVGMDTAAGAVGGVVGDRVVRGVAQFIGPTIGAAGRVLSDAGVNLSPGQAVRNIGSRFGRLLANTEDRLTGLPIVGDMISADRERAGANYVRGGYQRALGPVGEALPPVENGHEAAQFTRGAMTRAYNRAANQMQFIPDGQFFQEMNAISQRVTDGTLSESAGRQLQANVRSIVGQRLHANGGQMTGPQWKAVDSELRKRAASIDDPALRGALGDLRASLRDAAGRSSPPEASAAMDAADEAYANYARLRRASAGALEGNFSPNQLSTAVRASDTSIGKGDSAAGQALLQDYATAGRQVLPSRTGDSGTSTRESTINPLRWGLGAAAAIPYAAARQATPLLQRAPGPLAQSNADLLRRLAPATGALTLGQYFPSLVDGPP